MDFAREAKQNELLSAGLEAVHLYKVDVDDDSTDAFTDEAGVAGLPTYLLYDAGGTLIGRWSGYDDAERFLELQQGFLGDPMTLDARRARFGEEATPDDALLLWAAASSTESWPEALDCIQQADALREPGSEDLAFEVFRTHLAAAMDDAAELEPTLAAADAALASSDTSDDERVEVARYLGLLDEKLENSSFVGEYRQRVLELTSGSNEAEVVRARNALLVEKALEEGNKPAAAQYKRASYDPGWQDDPKKLNDFAWWSFENDVELEDAEAVAARGVELSERGPGRAMILDTQAEIAFKLGRPDDAIALIERAIEDDPEGELYKQQLERFRGEGGGEGD